MLPNAHYGFEERATAFFALGRSKSTQKPVAIITTSGTAVGELLPAIMEADYSAIPLLIITADRPRHYRHSGAPQTCNQIGIFSHYVCETQDLETTEIPNLQHWNQQRPIHLNVCFDEPLLPKQSVTTQFVPTPKLPENIYPYPPLDTFLQTVKNPIVILSGLRPDPNIKQFLLELNAPILVEATSNLREEPSLQHLIISRTNHILETAAQHNYPIDGILRIGGVPTIRLWRDLEVKKIPTFNLSEQRYPGLSWSTVHTTNLSAFFSHYEVRKRITGHDTWMQSEQTYFSKLNKLLQEEPQSEPALVHTLSTQIPQHSLIYLGNSMPIRQWDLTATRQLRHYHITASRGLNGIDGQISTFLGMCTPHKQNWAILGDLTALYDLSAPWFLRFIPDCSTNIVIINNGGGKIFERMFQFHQFQNQHNIHFEHFAKMWNMDYISTIPREMTPGNRIIELFPDADSTFRFWNRMENNK